MAGVPRFEFDRNRRENPLHKDNTELSLRPSSTPGSPTSTSAVVVRQQHRTTQNQKAIRAFMSRHCIRIEALVVIAIFCLPSNLLTLLLQIQLHRDQECGPECMQLTEEPAPLSELAPFPSETSGTMSMDAMSMDATSMDAMSGSSVLCSIAQTLSSVLCSSDAEKSSMRDLFFNCVFADDPDAQHEGKQALSQAICPHMVEEVCGVSDPSLSISPNSSMTPSEAGWLATASQCIVSIASFVQPSSLLSAQEPNEGQEDLEANFSCYDAMHATARNMRKGNFYIQGVALPIAGILGIMGNALTIVVLTRRIRRKQDTMRNFSKLLIFLGAIDLLLIVFFLLESLPTLLRYDPRWYVHIFPWLIYPGKGIMVVASILMVVAISMERYRAICYPLRHRPKPGQYLAWVLAISVVQSFPLFQEYQVSETASWSTSLKEHSTYVVFQAYYCILTQNIVPLLALVYYNLRIYLKIRSSSKYGLRFVGYKNFSSRRRDKRSRQQQLGAEPRGLVAPPPSSASNNNSNNGNNASNNANNGPNNSSNNNGNGNNGGVANNETLVPARPVLHTSCTNLSMATSLRAGLAARREQEDEGVVLDVAQLVPVVQGRVWHRLRRCPRQSSDSELLQRVDLGVYKIRRRRMKSFEVLTALVLAFFVFHSVETSVKVYEILFPTVTTADHHLHCFMQGLRHMPLWLYYSMSMSNLTLVLNSSANFLIYCLVEKRFRCELRKLLQPLLQPFIVAISFLLRIGARISQRTQ